MNIVVKWIILFALLLANYVKGDIKCSSSTSGSIPALTYNSGIAILSQRDASYNTSILELPTLGIRLKSVLFHNDEYTITSINQLRNVLDMGLGVLAIDLYWDETELIWQLCPVNNYTKNDQNIVCHSNATFEYVIGIIVKYIEDTEVDTKANLVQLGFYLHSLSASHTNYNSTINIDNDNKLSTILKSNFHSLLYTPASLENDRKNKTTVLYNQINSTSGYPTLKGFLYNTPQRRLIPMIFENYLKPNTTYDIVSEKDELFLMYNDDNYLRTVANQTIYDECRELLDSNNVLTSNSTILKASTEWSYLTDSNEYEFNPSMIHDFISCGYSTIVNSTLTNISEIHNNESLWSWGIGQPSTCESLNLTNRTRRVALNCAVFYNGQWSVANCYDEFSVLCRNGTEPYSWTITDKKASFFDAEKHCPSDTSFNIPKSSLQSTSLKIQLRALEISDPIWINLNSMSISNCWTTGGPYATCPYAQRTLRRSFIAMLIISCVVSVLLILFCITQFQKIPLHKNSKRWKKLINKYSEYDYDGVPA